MVLQNCWSLVRYLFGHWGQTGAGFRPVVILRGEQVMGGAIGCTVGGLAGES